MAWGDQDKVATWGTGDSVVTPAYTKALADARAVYKAAPHDAVDSAIQGATLGFGDEAQGLVSGGITAAKGLLSNIGLAQKPAYTAADAYRATVQAARESQAAYHQRHPVIDTGAQIAGGFVAPGVGESAGLINGAKTLGGAALRSAGVGAAYGAAAGAGNATGGLMSRVTGAGQGAVVGGLIGAAAPVVARAAVGLMSRAGPTLAPAAEAAPTLDTLSAARDAAYKAVDDAGVEYKPEAVNTLVQGVKDDAHQAMIDPDLHPKASAVVNRISQLQDSPVTLGKLDQVRRLVRDNAISGASSPDEARIGRRILNNIDEFIDAAGPDQITASSGDPEQAAATIRQARDLNTRVRKIETINDSVEAARLRAGSTGSGGNVNNATRQNLRQVLQKGRFTDDESQALEDIVLGTPGQNAMRQVGKLSPAGNGLGLMLHAGAALGTHGVSLGLAGVGMAAKHAADRMTQNRVAQLIQMIAGGSDSTSEAAARELAQIAQRSRGLMRASPVVAATVGGYTPNRARAPQ